MKKRFKIQRMPRNRFYCHKSWRVKDTHQPDCFVYDVYFCKPEAKKRAKRLNKKWEKALVKLDSLQRQVSNQKRKVRLMFK